MHPFPHALLLLAATVHASSARAEGSEAPASRDAREAPETPADWLGAVGASIARAEYEFHALGGDRWTAPNWRHGLRIRVDREGLAFFPREHDASGEGAPWRLEMSLRAWGRPDELVAPATGVARAEGARLEIARGPLVEWYVNREDGLEQGFDLATRPAGEGPLVLELELGPDLRGSVHEDRRGVGFEDGTGAAVLLYRGLFVVDARGDELSAELAFHLGRLQIRVDDRGAVYPIVVDPVLTGPTWIADSDQAGAAFGLDVSTAGDVDGDGFSDLVVGAPWWDHMGSNTGRAYLFRGSPAGLSTSPALALDGRQAISNFGRAVSTAGDVNGDGYADFLVGAPFADTAAGADAGEVVLYYGGAGALATPRKWTRPGTQAGARFGATLAPAGDVNADGFDDFLVGESRFTHAFAQQGRVHLYLGSASGPSKSPSWTVSGDTPMAELSAVAAAGDVDGDGYPDVLIGAPGRDNGPGSEGRAYVYAGGPGGLAATPLWIADGEQEGSEYGSRLAGLGDVNGDGHADVVVAARAFSDGGGFAQGRAYVHHGSPGGPWPTPSWIRTGSCGGADCHLGEDVATAGDVNGDAYADLLLGGAGGPEVFLGSASGLRATPAWSAGWFGFEFDAESVACAGDVNGDGFGDVVIGAYDHGDASEPLEGRAYVFHGSAHGVTLENPWYASDLQPSSGYAQSVAAAGDVNGDGYGDVLVGAPGYDGMVFGEGAVFLHLGSRDGLAAAPTWSALGGQNGSSFGWALSSAGDVNGDGYDDLIVGAHHYDGTISDTGRAFLYLGNATGAPTESGWLAQGDQQGAGFGIAVAGAGDVNGDGFADVVVGEPAYDAGQAVEGRAHVYLGGPAGLSPMADWTVEGNQVGARLGRAVAGAGDVDGDGYADVLVGAPEYSATASLEGRALLYRGGPSGPELVPSWTADGGQALATFGRALAGAGDVNGDGYADVIVGAPNYDEPGLISCGKVSVFLGTAAGLTGLPFWTKVGTSEVMQLGTSVDGAGDVNGDGRSDVVVGAPEWSSQTYPFQGIAFVYLGSGLALADSPVANVQMPQEGADVGRSVAGAGDVNGDGFDDVLVGAPHHDAFVLTDGLAILRHGNEKGKALRPRQANEAPHGGNIALHGSSSSPDAFRMLTTGRSAAGRTWIKLQWEVEAVPDLFDGSRTGTAASFALSSAPGPDGSTRELVATATGLDPATVYKWRVRVLSRNPYFPRSPWKSLSGGAIELAKLRTAR